MKYWILIFFILQFKTLTYAQGSASDSLYQKAMSLYDEKEYHLSAQIFDMISIDQKITDLDMLYNASCVYSLNSEHEKAMLLLKKLAGDYYYADITHLSSDADLNNLHSSSDWNLLLEKVKQNKITLPQRRRDKIRTELLKTKKLLDADNGKLWKKNLWNENLLVLDDENNIYTLNNSTPNTTNDNGLYYKQIKENTIVPVNTNQIFEGKNWAIVQNYDVTVADSCETPIHELFHLYQSTQISLSGNIVEYLDDYRAKIWIRSEFEALRNCIRNIQKKDSTVARKYLDAAIYFRTQREKQFQKQNHFALELESLEGLASYTGYKLSAYQNLYSIAIFELDGRENPTGLNRSFAYATGLAYGLIYDYFDIPWRTDLKHIYSFKEIYKTHIGTLHWDKKVIETMKLKNKYYEIQKEEYTRKSISDSIRLYYKNMFQTQPTLVVKRDTSDKTYLISFDMNSTFVFENKNIIYANISSSSSNPLAFGNFKTTGETEIGKTGILITSDFHELTFPKPLKIEGHTITGENYSIELNEGWTVKQVDKKGNLQIVKQ